MEAAHAARVLMGDSLGFHIVFVLFGLGLPVLVNWFEWWGIKRNDQKLIDLAHFWSKIMAVLVITGVVSGTIIALQMSLVWPGILQFGGEVIGLPFLFETYAFLIEAVFLALYMVTWNKKSVPRVLHAAFGSMIILGSTMSAYAITSINGWMNLPTGFDIVAGKFENIDVLQAMFSRTALIEFFHSMIGYYLACFLTVAGLYALKIARSRYQQRLGSGHKLDWLIVHRLMMVAALLFVLSGVTADLTGKYLAKYEPVKLAAIELNDTTRANAPLIIGGVPGENGQATGPHFEIPGALSLLAGNSTKTEVKGLNEYPEKDRPPLYVHTLFDIKMTIITFFALGVVAFFGIKYLRPQWMARRWVLLPLSTGGILAIILVELGWMMTEIGRQPWAVRGYVTTEQALTKTHNVASFGYVFPLLYVVLFCVTVIAIHRLVNDEKHRKGGTL